MNRVAQVRLQLAYLALAQLVVASRKKLVCRIWLTGSGERFADALEAIANFAADD